MHPFVHEGRSRFAARASKPPMTSLALFAAADPEYPLPDVALLRGYASNLSMYTTLLSLLSAAPLRSMQTPHGPMSVDTTNCGAYGWTSDARGYRYVARDPLSGAPWPAIPPDWYRLAQRAAEHAGFGEFEPDSCLINRYRVGAKMGSHQDRDELDFVHPIVSMSFGIPARFFIKPAAAGSKAINIVLTDGDVLVWGRSARLLHHGIRPLAAGVHPLLGPTRINFTLRKAG
jgi:DNA oxidative demethylase